MAVPEVFAASGEAVFRELEKRVLPRALQPGAVVALGGGALIDDGSWRLVERETYTVYLQVPFETLRERIQARPARPLASGRSREEGVALFDQRPPGCEHAAHAVDGDRAPDW